MITIAKPNIGEEEKRAVNEVLESGMIACGAVTNEFENKFAEYIGTSHAIATTSGTTALEVALRALELQPGDKVLTTTYSFIATANAILYAGLIPVFADISENFNMDVDCLEEIYEANNGIKAVLVVHLFGRPCNMDRIQHFVDKHKLYLVEDCAQAHGATWNGKKVGSFGHAAAFSFYPTKNMTTGEGGMVTTNSSEIADKARLLINHGMKVRYHHDIIGYNYRMTNLSAAIGLSQLKKLDDMNECRIRNARYYIAHINNENLILPEATDGHVFHQFTIRVLNKKRDEFVRYLEEKQIGYGIFYPLTMPEQRCYENKGFVTHYEMADIIKGQVISLPIHPRLEKDELRYVAECINDFN